MTYLFKATDGHKATHGGRYTYRKDRWTRTEPLDPCRTGWHVARDEQILNWLAPTLWLAEIHPDAEWVDHGDKIVASKIRLVERLDTWNDRTARLFAADCAESALKLVGSPDPRSVDAVRVARLFANGDANSSEFAAAGDAALDAAWAAAWDASADAARDAAMAAAWAAAWGAAGDAARAAAMAAAADAAGAAAKAAAWAAAADATGDAARADQYRCLLGYLELGGAA